jgi:hypothetical protein
MYCCLNMAAPALKTELTGTGKSSAFNMGFFLYR